MKNVEILGHKFDVDEKWNWICIDEVGEVTLYVEKPVYGSWDGADCSACWETLSESEWESLGYIPVYREHVLKYIGEDLI